MEERGLIFNKQGYSLHDGPGIRMTVFFKGCPLNCWWCHNPEGINKKQEQLVREKNCIGCGSCQHKNNQFSEFSQEICPTDAIQQVGEWVNTTELLDDILRDEIFFDVSKGGVTLSGGEPLMQPNFLNEMLKKCQTRGVHTTVDTSGYAPWYDLEMISNKVDLFLYDLKIIDESNHKHFTGVSNKVILDNLKYLSRIHQDIIIRFPIIPTVTDDHYNVLSIGDYMLKQGLTNIHILPYHDFAQGKYDQIGKNYNLNNITPPSNEDVDRVKSLLEDLGLKVTKGG